MQRITIATLAVLVFFSTGCMQIKTKEFVGDDGTRVRAAYVESPLGIFHPNSNYLSVETTFPGSVPMVNEMPGTEGSAVNQLWGNGAGVAAAAVLSPPTSRTRIVNDAQNSLSQGQGQEQGQGAKASASAEAESESGAGAKIIDNGSGKPPMKMK